MQQGGNGKILVASRLKDEGSDTHQVRNVRDRRGFPGLPFMFLRRELEGAQEARTKLDFFAWPLLALRRAGR
jgi:hypothetical protein